ncbi:hypothetical protein SAMN05443665_104020 [Actinomadura meyerae]|jgi:hypothetical protein|uniref:Peptidase family U32 n=1 Tax=Actinomadura meyerae TaxID=240840 RepID=A0A239NEN2_9ACTN|nr:hypothetical protein [Actinomadura meyerae]SNT53351.1 hypothetical protein SAMN05443665_104020 [Actinomadura meyerae]
MAVHNPPVGLDTGSSPSQSRALPFEDGGLFRIEIPSVEGPDALDAVLEEAERLNVTVHRISQGSGVAMLSDAEIRAMVDRTRAARIELCLFLGPRGTWDIGAGTRTPSGGAGPRVRGEAQLRYSLEDAARVVELGVRCLLVADEGVLWELHKARLSGDLPGDVKLKLSALAGPANPASFAVIEMLGADSINVPGDLPVADLAAMRRASATPIDIYIESPDALGGYVRQHEAPAFIDHVAPVYLKFGLRNAPEMYPSGEHTRALSISSSRERVRRAALMLEHLDRIGYLKHMSPAGAPVTTSLRRFAEPA